MAKKACKPWPRPGREGKALDPIRDKYNKYDDGMEEGIGDAVKQVGSMAKKLGQKAITTLGHGDDAAMMRDLQNKMNMPQTGMKPASKYNTDPIPKDAVYDPFHPDDKYDAANAASKQQVKEKMSPAKAKSFAALAEPKDKITFADKIAGAKKEVDEMLGDVAAEAMKNALRGKQTVADEGNAFTGKLKDTPKGGKFKLGNKEFTDTSDVDEGWDDMIKDVERRRSATKKGEITHGHKHDIEDTGTGRRVTRRTDPNTGYSVGADSDEPASGEKRGRGRPKGAPKAPERVTGKAYKHKGGRKTTEDYGPMEETAEFSGSEVQQAYRLAVVLKMFVTDPEGRKVWSELVKLLKYKLDQSNDTLGEKAPPGAKAERMVKHIKAGYTKDGKLSDREKGIAYATAWKAKKAGKVEEESDETRDERAEKAGRKVAKDIEYDEKKKDGIHGKKRGGEDDKAEKAGKKVTKDIEYDEKKKKVKEQDNAGKSGGGMTFGKGIYDSLDRDVEKLISEGFNVSVNMSIDSNGEPTKNVSVNADGDDADKLAELLNLAGMQNSSYGGSGYKSACGCGQPDCSCGDDIVDEAYGDTDETRNQPDWPTNTEYSDDAFQYSGGLNKPKSTGQTTIPVVASQLERQHAYEAQDLGMKLYAELKSFKG
jgi:hypothetical protein